MKMRKEPVMVQTEPTCPKAFGFLFLIILPSPPMKIKFVSSISIFISLLLGVSSP